jgi:hypothetical protein
LYKHASLVSLEIGIPEETGMKKIVLALGMMMLLPGCEYMSQAMGRTGNSSTAPVQQPTIVVTHQEPVPLQPAISIPKEPPKKVGPQKISPAMSGWLKEEPPEKKPQFTHMGGDRPMKLPMSPAMLQWIRSSPPEKKPQIRMMVEDSKRN